MLCTKFDLPKTKSIIREADFTMKGINRQNLGIEAEYAPAEPRKYTHNNQPVLGVPNPTEKKEKTFDSRYKLEK